MGEEVEDGEIPDNSNVPMYAEDDEDFEDD